MAASGAEPLKIKILRSKYILNLLFFWGKKEEKKNTANNFEHCLKVLKEKTK